MTSSKPIVVDEEEPDTDVEEPTYNSSEVEIQTDKWVPEEFQILNFLGRGKFGEVKRCSEFRTGSEFAAKFICTPRPQDKTDVAHEVYIMKKLRHRRLIQLYSAFEAKCEMCLVLEIVYGGELFERVISEDFTLSEKACTCFVRQICEGVQYIHSRNIIHLDLKPENIMCLSRSGNRIKIIDFGLAREYDPKKDTRVLFGTPEFMAPEVVLFDPIHFATDMWSIGVMTYVLLSGLSPFMGDTDTATLSNVTVGKYSLAHREFSKVSENAKDFITNLLITDKRKRYTATMCLEHPWLQKQLQSDIPHLDISKQQLKTYVYRRKWMKAVNALIALKRIGVPLKSFRTMTQSSTLDHRNSSKTSESPDVTNNYCSKTLEPISSLKHSIDPHKTVDTQSTHASKVDSRQRFEPNVDAATPKKQPKTPKSLKTVDKKLANGVDATKFGELNNTSTTFSSKDESRGLAWSKENKGCESLAEFGIRRNNVLKKLDGKQTNHRHGAASNLSRLRNIFSNNRT